MTTIENKKNEVAELRNLLESPAVRSDDGKRCEVLKRVVEAFTLGIDVSSLFSNIIMMANTQDLIQKKLIYLFLSKYAETSPDLTMLAVNTLLKDCADEDPATRGLALRQLCNLRAPTIVEYLSDPVKTALADRSSYVRKTAVFGCLRLAILDSFDPSFYPTLYAKLQDRDNQVRISAIIVLSRISQLHSKTLSLPRSCLFSLLNDLSRLPCFLQAIVLEMTSFVSPASEDELFTLLNIVDSRLDHYENSSVVMAAADVMIKLTKDRPDLIGDVIDRISEPLLTLINDIEKPEISIIALGHIKHLIELSNVFCSIEKLKKFVIRRFESTATSRVKINLLAKAAIKSNQVEVCDWVLDELSHLLYHKSDLIAIAAINAITLIASRQQDMTSKCLRLFCEILGNATAISNFGITLTPAHYTCCSAIRQIVSLTSFSGGDSKDFCISLVCRLLSIERGALFVKNGDDHAESALISLLYVLNLFKSEIPESPYLVEQFCMSSVFNELSLIAQIQLINSVFSIFVEYPAKCAPILKILYSLAKGSMYYEVSYRIEFLMKFVIKKDLSTLGLLLKCDAEEFRILDDLDNENAVAQLAEFNTIKMIEGYNQSSISAAETSCKPIKILLVDHDEPLNFDSDGDVPEQSSRVEEVEEDLLDFAITNDDDDDDDDDVSAFELLVPCKITPKEFQRCWSQFSSFSPETKSLQRPFVNDKELVRNISSRFENLVKVIAHGQPGPDLVRVFFALKLDIDEESFVLFECLANPNGATFTPKYSSSVNKKFVSELVEFIEL
ncbi:hypothetical protein GEMRC1_003809 [Eukaryota sp. GEM-RC1]